MKSSIVIVAIVVAIIGFYGGMKYGQSKSTVTGNSQYGAGGARTGGVGARFRGANGGSATAGDVLSKDASSLAVKTRDGSSKLIFYSASTPITKMVSGSADDVQAGTAVTVEGTPNSDGSINAQMIQIRPAGQGLFGGVTTTKAGQ